MMLPGKQLNSSTPSSPVYCAEDSENITEPYMSGCPNPCFFAFESGAGISLQCPRPSFSIEFQCLINHPIWFRLPLLLKKTTFSSHRYTVRILMFIDWDVEYARLPISRTVFMQLAQWTHFSSYHSQWVVWSFELLFFRLSQTTTNPVHNEDWTVLISASAIDGSPTNQ